MARVGINFIFPDPVLIVEIAHTIMSQAKIENCLSLLMKAPTTDINPNPMGLNSYEHLDQCFPHLILLCDTVTSLVLLFCDFLRCTVTMFMLLTYIFLT